MPMPILAPSTALDTQHLAQVVACFVRLQALLVVIGENEAQRYENLGDKINPPHARGD